MTIETKKGIYTVPFQFPISVTVVKNETYTPLVKYLSEKGKFIWKIKMSKRAKTDSLICVNLIIIFVACLIALRH